MTDVTLAEPIESAVLLRKQCATVMATTTGDHASEIDELARTIRGGVQGMHRNVFEIGRALLQAKRILEHGAFLGWLDREFGWAPRTAQRFMSVAARLDRKYDSLSHLGVETLYKLAAPSTPDAVIEAVIDKVEAGEDMSAKDVAVMIRQETPRKPASLGTANAHGAAAQAAITREPLEATAIERREVTEATDQAFALLKAKLERDRLRRIAWLLIRCDIGELVRRIEECSAPAK